MRALSPVVFLLLAAGCVEDSDRELIDDQPALKATPLAVPEHVVLISIDTLRADHVGVYGSTIKTPNIDALARDSVRFAQAWPASTTTLSSHTSMLTGLFPHNHGVPFNGTIVDPENQTLAEVLKDNGFATIGVIGGPPVRGSTGLGQGFDTYTGPERPGSRGNQTAAAALTASGGGRTFLFMHYWDAHWPYTSPEPWSHMYRTDDLPLRGTMAEIKELRKDLHSGVEDAPARSEAMKGAYSGAVSYTDSLVGGLITDLKAQGIYEDALIILTSDHGESTDEHWDYWTHGKSTYESAIHVPLIIKLPAQANANTVVDTPVSLVDLFPTVLDLLNIQAPLPADGVSLVDALAQKPMSRGPIFVEATAPNQNEKINGNHWINQYNCAAILENGTKYHHCPWRGDSLHELYDLTADPGEHTNLLPTRDASTLQEQLLAHRAQTTPRHILTEDSEDMTLALKALGYIE